MAKQTSKKSQPTKGAVKQADVVQMLKADHKQVQKLFDRFRVSADDEKSSIAGQLFAELDVHARLEEEIFYPAVRAKLEPVGFESSSEGNGLDLIAGEEADVMQEDDQIDGVEMEAVDEDEEDEAESEGEELITAAYDSHQTVKDLIQQLRTLNPRGHDYLELFDELEEAVIEHVAEEEEVILPMAASELDVEALGMEMQRRKDDLQSRRAA